MRFHIFIFSFSIAGLAAADRAWSEDRICVEEVAGVCLKFETAAPKPQISPAEAAERRLALDATARKWVQRGLAADGCRVTNATASI